MNIWYPYANGFNFEIIKWYTLKVNEKIVFLGQENMARLNPVTTFLWSSLKNSEKIRFARDEGLFYFVFNEKKLMNLNHDTGT